MDVADVGPDRDQLAAEQACLESFCFRRVASIHIGVSQFEIERLFAGGQFVAFLKEFQSRTILTCVVHEGSTQDISAGIFWHGQ